MEEMLPFLAGLAYMAYKFYSNFKKEQEEARKRDPSRPHQEEPRESYQDWFDSQPEPEPVYVPQPAPVRPSFEGKYQEPKYEPTYREPMPAKPVRESLYREPGTKIPRKVELYNPDVPAEAVLRTRTIQQPSPYHFEPSHEEEILSSDFDFRDAIIKEAILNRPKY